MRQVRALLAFEVDMEKGLIHSWGHVFCRDSRQRPFTEIVHESQVGCQCEVVLVPCVSFGTSIIRNAPDRSSRINSMRYPEIIQYEVQHACVKGNLALVERRGHSCRLNIDNTKYGDRARTVALHEIGKCPPKSNVR